MLHSFVSVWAIRTTLDERWNYAAQKKFGETFDIASRH